MTPGLLQDVTEPKPYIPDDSLTLPETVVERAVCRTESRVQQKSEVAHEFATLLSIGERMSNWVGMVNVIRLVYGKSLNILDNARQRQGMSLACRNPEIQFKDAELILFKLGQIESFPDDIIP